MEGVVLAKLVWIAVRHFGSRDDALSGSDCQRQLPRSRVISLSACGEDKPNDRILRPSNDNQKEEEMGQNEF